MNERDPRIDPQRGDMVRSTVSKNTLERMVTDRIGNDIWYKTYTTTGKCYERLCWITTWQDWCRANKVTCGAEQCR